MNGYMFEKSDNVIWKMTITKNINNIHKKLAFYFQIGLILGWK